MNPLMQKQLERVMVADLSNHDPIKCEFNIKKRVDVKLSVNSCYIIHLTEKTFNNEVLCVNWNGNKMPETEYLMIDVQKVMGKMINVNALGYDNDSKAMTNYRWSGWLSIEGIEVLEAV